MMDLEKVREALEKRRVFIDEALAQCENLSGGADRVSDLNSKIHELHEKIGDLALRRNNELDVNRLREESIKKTLKELRIKL